MAEASTFQYWAESLESLDYYEILRVPENASTAEIQEAFHEMSLRCHPDRFVDEGPEVAAAAGTVFKRLAEAYNILRKPAFRKRYDASLGKGALKLDERAIEQKQVHEQRTLFMIARTPRAKLHAAKADEALAKGALDEARIHLITANQHDPANPELTERLEILYEALLLEPGDLL